MAVVNKLRRVGGPLTLAPDGSTLWASAGDACISPRYGFVGCPQHGLGVMHVLRTGDMSLLGTFSRPEFRIGWPRFSPDGRRVLLTSGTLTAIDPTSMKAVESLPIRDGGSAAFSPDGRTLYVGLSEESVIAEFDAMPAGCEPPEQGLSDYWPADGATDNLHGGMLAELKQGGGFGPGVFGQAFSFDGRGGHVRFSERSDLYGASPETTLSVWVKFHRTDTEMTVLDRQSAAADAGWRLWRDSGGALRLEAAQPGRPASLITREPVAPDRWYHVAIVRRPADLELYLDGVLQSQTAYSSAVNFMPMLLPMRAGLDQHGRMPMNGLLDELLIYYRALPPEEIRSMYLHGATACAA